MTFSDTLHGRAETPPPYPSEHLPIGPGEVRAGIARELHVLADLALSETDAMARATAITAAKIRNSPVLVERQAHDGQCHACHGPLDDARPVVAVMQVKGGGHLWMHGGACHEAHSRRRAALVDKIMAAAGYGDASTLGECA